jgi:drug/metabolite transporter (DMT)-like permease
MAWFVFLGCARVSAANASMADALTPLMIFAAASVKARHIDGRGIFGLLCGFLGALLVIQIIHRGGFALEAYSVGDVYVLLAAATWGVYTVWGRPLITRIGSQSFTTWTMLVGAAAIGVFLPFLDVAWPKDAKSWSLVACLAFVCTLMPFWTWNAAQKYLPMSLLGVTAYFTPVVAVALAAVFLGEKATALQWIGTIFIIVSAVVETKGASRAG